MNEAQLTKTLAGLIAAADTSVLRGLREHLRGSVASGDRPDTLLERVEELDMVEIELARRAR